MVTQLRVIGPAKKEVLVDVSQSPEQMKTVTVLELKKKIIEKLRISPDSDLRLVFTTQTLEESRLLSFYGIQHMSTIHTLLRQPGGQQQLRVILPTRGEKVLDLCESQEQMQKMTVQEVKRRISAEQWTGPGIDLRLVFGTKTLEDLQPLSSYGIKHMSTVHTVQRQPGGQQQLRVILPTSSEKVLDLCESQEQMQKMTIQEVKRRISAEQWTGLGIDLRLVFGTQTLEDLQPLSSYGIKHLSIIRTLARVPGGTC